MRAVYIIAEEGADVCKIGITNNTHKRVTVLQTGHPRALYVAGAWTVDDAEALEGAVHEALASKRLVGEWFEVSSAHAAFVIGHVCASRGVPFEQVSMAVTQRPRKERVPVEAVSPLHNWRLANKISLHQLATLVGTAHTTLSRAERGEVHPRRELAKRIMEVTGLTRDQLAEPWLSQGGAA